MLPLIINSATQGRTSHWSRSLCDMSVYHGFMLRKNCSVASDLAGEPFTSVKKSPNLAVESDRPMSDEVEVDVEPDGDSTANGTVEATGETAGA